MSHELDNRRNDPNTKLKRPLHIHITRTLDLIYIYPFLFIQNFYIYKSWSQARFDPPRHREVYYQTTALPPSHHGWIEIKSLFISKVRKRKDQYFGNFTDFYFPFLWPFMFFCQSRHHAILSIILLQRRKSFWQFGLFFCKLLQMESKVKVELTFQPWWLGGRAVN